MILVGDVGNTSTVLGAWINGELKSRFRFRTEPRRMEGEYALLLKGFLDLEELPLPQAALISSVVPAVDGELAAALKRLFGLQPLLVQAEHTGLEVLVDHPAEVGIDRLVNAVGALRRPGVPRYQVIIDFGTATTFDLVEAPSRYLGGAIAPGPRTAAEALARNTAKLPQIDLRPPRQVIGKNTEEALRSGIVLGYASLIEGMIERFRQALGPLGVLATGGFASTLAPLCPSLETVDPDLTLKGLYAIWQAQG
jgi:type III pantothenate kinase